MSFEIQPGNFGINLEPDDEEFLEAYYRDIARRGRRRDIFIDIHYWQRMSQAMSEGNTYDWWDFTNYLAIRDQIEEVIDKASMELAQKLRPVVSTIDEMFFAGTQPSNRPLNENFDLKKHPWYGRIPKVLEGPTEDKWLRFK